MAAQIRKKTELRKQRKEFEKAFPKQRELVFLLAGWDDGYNVGGLFRSAAACGAKEIVMAGKTPTPDDDPRVGVTSLGFHRRLPWRSEKSAFEVVQALRSEGYQIVAVEVTDAAENYMAFEFGEKCCLVLGNEGAGLGAKLVAACDASVMIPMYGKGRSLNVQVAGAIVGFEAMMRGSEK